MRHPLHRGLPLVCAAAALGAGCVAALVVGTSLVSGTVGLQRLVLADPTEPEPVLAACT
ncbi:hypothetical protein [Clavibacter michiganensis]|nr:hypothetical protein [Clavibacter michiganensis]KAF0259886.1 hypothetical protein DOU02_00975 [Clavibacter michiganensis subsp. michiganensis]MDO4032082.1 hypothetical protein [Clavibacter michiganensis]MDO4045281.1 hypothetical protein [Clavibacter michiganensis]MDO4054429.1 hypothetical protein [Clavibacter michiganensis]MDO4057657.1 hypothetical protein [Clavibacter michiganensis]